MGIFCLLYQNKLAALASGELPERLAARVEQHLSACPDCLSEWASHKRLAEALRGATPGIQPASPYLWDRLEATIHAEAGAPSRHSSRRLAPLGALALAGAAAAALFITRPHTSPTLVASQTPATPAATPLQVTQVSPSPKPLSAVELARKSERKVLQNRPPQASYDPFVTHRSARVKREQERLKSEQLVARLRAARAPRRPHLPDPQEDSLPKRTQDSALVQLAQGTLHIQTAEFNREVTEAEQHERGAAHRASCAPTEAIASARGEANLGIFQ
jgi:Putative zinc-finger